MALNVDGPRGFIPDLLYSAFFLCQLITSFYFTPHMLMPSQAPPFPPSRCTLCSHLLAEYLTCVSWKPQTQYRQDPAFCPSSSGNLLFVCFLWVNVILTQARASSASPLLYQALVILLPKWLSNLSSSLHFFQLFAVSSWTTSMSIHNHSLFDFKGFLSWSANLPMLLLCSQFFKGSLCPKDKSSTHSAARKTCNPALPTPVVTSPAPPHLIITML